MREIKFLDKLKRALKKPFYVIRNKLFISLFKMILEDGIQTEEINSVYLFYKKHLILRYREEEE